jgi:hypothetical protein
MRLERNVNPIEHSSVSNNERSKLISDLTKFMENPSRILINEIKHGICSLFNERMIDDGNEVK